MQAAIKLTARVQAGHRVEFTAPELIEGEEVEIFVALPGHHIPAPLGEGKTQGVWDLIQSLTPVQRTSEEWAEIEREFQEERASWDF